jgi:aerobic-type carbon monoxide dehydrogenase small subunit (CoxS/CutS family)
MNSSTIRLGTADQDPERAAQVNGRAVAVPDDTTRLIDWLRGTVGLSSPKEGCGEGHCGACTVLVNGQPRLACCTFAASAVGANVMTAERVSSTALGSRLATSFVEHGALQCGYCSPGMLVTAFSLLSGGGQVSEQEVRQALIGNVCRCTGYVPIVAAIIAAGHARK